jgi:hypothetical protein
LEGWQKTRCFFVLGPFAWAIAHSFGVLDWLQGPWYSLHVWGAWQKIHHFCVLRPFSWASAHCFGVPWRFTRNMIVSTFCRGTTKKLVCSVYGHFFEVLPIVLGCQSDLQGPWHSVHVWEAWSKTHRFCVYDYFCELLPIVLGFWGDLQGPWHSVHFLEAWPKTRHFLHSRAIFISY